MNVNYRLMIVPYFLCIRIFTLLSNEFQFYSSNTQVVFMKCNLKCIKISVNNKQINCLTEKNPEFIHNIDV